MGVNGWEDRTYELVTYIEYLQSIASLSTSELVLGSL